MLKLILAALILHSGVATYYAEEQFGGGPLYCDQFVTDRRLVYDRNLTEDWAAFDVSWYGKYVDCGDLVLLVFEGETLTVRAWDAGRFSRYYVEDWGPDKPILVDLPEYLRLDGQMSWPVLVVNLSKLGLGEMP